MIDPDFEPTDAELLAALIDEQELDLMEADLSEDLIADEIGLVSDQHDMSAEEAAIHVIAVDD
jgi:hypothetical protein